MKKKEHKECKSDLLPIQDTLNIIGGKWKLLIMGSIADGNVHFSEIARSIPKLSAKVLANELKELEQNKLIIRKVISGFPVRTEYTVTKHALSLKKVIKELSSWGIRHRKEVIVKS